jgi:phosphate transport system permease protein
MTDTRLLQRRRRREAVFRRAGQLSLLFAATMLVFLLWSIASTGWQAFRQTLVQVPVDLTDVTPEQLATLLPARNATASLPSGQATPVNGRGGGVRPVNTRVLVMQSLEELFPQVRARGERRQLQQLLSTTAPDVLRRMLADTPQLAGGKRELWLPAADDLDQFHKHGASAAPRLTPVQFTAIRQLQADGRLRFRFNSTFFTASDSREPEAAGIFGSVIGSLLTLAVAFLLAFPLGVAAAVYLEEFASRTNRWKDLIEVNINNLAAVPSIIYGLLGLAVFLTFFGLPRSTPLVGGLVLGLMTLPIIIIATRAALKAVPDSIRQAAQGLGASPVQTVLHQVLPCAMPGILTGTIIGMAHALGETAPLLLIGMVAFMADVPQGFFDPATVLPVQIYIWGDSPERGFVEKTSAAILALMVFLMAMNALAIYLRRKLEKQW